jgi:hypothetical protein
MGNPFDDDYWPSDSKKTQVRYDPEVPFVVDLPDGQKLLVGELPEGTVIEVAAWRGTSKPDSRTTRLLLGVKKDAPSVPEELVIGDVPESASEGKDRRMARKAKRRHRAWIGTLIAVVIIAIGGIAFYFSPLEIMHPTEGTDIGFGPASSVLVITVPADKIQDGQMLVGENSDNALVLGRVSAFGGKDVLLQTSTGYSQIVTSSVKGSVVLLVPFLGYLF